MTSFSRHHLFLLLTSSPVFTVITSLFYRHHLCSRHHLFARHNLFARHHMFSRHHIFSRHHVIMSSRHDFFFTSTLVSPSSQAVRPTSLVFTSSPVFIIACFRVITFGEQLWAIYLMRTLLLHMSSMKHLLSLLRLHCSTDFSLSAAATPK